MTDVSADRADSAIEVLEIVDASPVDALFQRRFGHPAPKSPHHVVARVVGAAGHQEVACYIHFTDAGGGLFLGGGACIDERVLRRAAPAVRAEAKANGGLYAMTLAWSVRHFAAGFPAVFGYCGDVLAERADLAVGFERTPYAHLLVYWTKALGDDERSALVARAHAIGPF